MKIVDEQILWPKIDHDISFQENARFCRKLAKIDENWQKSSKIGKTRQDLVKNCQTLVKNCEKLAKIVENIGEKLRKIGENRRKLTKIAENW
jgi:hypothetical protein